MTVTSPNRPGVRRVEHVMGMPILVDVRDDAFEEAALERLFGWFEWVDETFSTYKEGSEISRLGRAELALEDAHANVREVLARCDEVRLETDGYFDVLATGSLDPSGLVKGWSVDRGAAILDAAGVRNYALNAGGDIWLRGRGVPDPHWRVGIEHPLEHDKIAAVVAISDGAVATSATYARGGHVTDPFSGRAPEGVLSVTITGPELATADAYATAAFAMGEDGPAWTAAALCAIAAASRATVSASPLGLLPGALRPYASPYFNGSYWTVAPCLPPGRALPVPRYIPSFLVPGSENAACVPGRRSEEAQRLREAALAARSEAKGLPATIAARPWTRARSATSRSSRTSTTASRRSPIASSS